MTEPIIKLDHVSFCYNGHEVLKDVTFTVDPGDFLALIGPNGGGKTTLLKLMLGLLKPEQGHIRVLGGRPGTVSRQIGYVPQDIHINKDFPISVKDVTLMGCLRKHHRLGFDKKDHKAAQKALEAMEMWHLRNSRMKELSGGQRQRVFIARALATDPAILFLDEPTASIDTPGQTRFYEMLKNLNQDVSIVLASHDVMLLSSYVKSVACVNQLVYYHDDAEITEEMLGMVHCPVEVIAHGLPHRVLKAHNIKPK